MVKIQQLAKIQYLAAWRAAMPNGKGLLSHDMRTLLPEALLHGEVSSSLGESSGRTYGKNLFAHLNGSLSRVKDDVQIDTLIPVGLAVVAHDGTVPAEVGLLARNTVSMILTRDFRHDASNGDLRAIVRYATMVLGYSAATSAPGAALPRINRRIMEDLATRIGNLVYRSDSSGFRFSLRTDLATPLRVRAELETVAGILTYPRQRRFLASASSLEQLLKISSSSGSGRNGAPVPGTPGIPAAPASPAASPVRMSGAAGTGGTASPASIISGYRPSHEAPRSDSPAIQLSLAVTRPWGTGASFMTASQTTLQNPFAVTVRAAPQAAASAVSSAAAFAGL